MNKIKFQITFTDVPNSMLEILKSQKIDISKEIFVRFNRDENLEILAQMSALYKLDELRIDIEKFTTEAVTKAINNLNLSN